MINSPPFALPDIERGHTLVGIGGELKSQNFVAGSAGWQITGAGAFEASSGIFRGDLVAGSITATEIAAGTITTDELGADSVTTVKINGSAVTSAKIADLAVTNGKLVDNAVNAAKIATNAVEVGHIIDGAVSTLKIANDAITNAKVAVGAIDTAEIATDAITTAKIVAGAVQAGEIAADAVVADKIAANAVTTDKIYANAITSAKIAANQVTASEIAAGTITATEIAADAVTANKIEATAINGHTITGATIQTAASGDRVTMKSAGGKLTFDVNASPTGYTEGYLNATLSGTSAYMVLRAPRMHSSPAWGPGIVMYDHVDGTSSIVLQLASNTGGPGLRIEDTGISITNSTLSVSGTITGNLAGAVLGNVTGNVSGTAATVTTAAQPAITSVGTLTSLTVSGTITGNLTGAVLGNVTGTAVSVTLPAQPAITSVGSSLGIGTTSASRELSINGSTNAYMSFDEGGTEGWVVGYEGGTNNRFIIYGGTPGGTRAYRLLIDDSGYIYPQGLAAVAGTGLNINASYGMMQLDTSSIRYKNLATEEVRTELPVDLIDELDPKVFAYKAAPDLPHVGLIAEEAHTISPYLALCDYNDGDPIPETVYWPAVISLLIKAVQELRTR